MKMRQIYGDEIPEEEYAKVCSLGTKQLKQEEKKSWLQELEGNIFQDLNNNSGVILGGSIVLSPLTGGRALTWAVAGSFAFDFVYDNWDRICDFFGSVFK